NAATAFASRDSNALTKPCIAARTAARSLDRGSASAVGAPALGAPLATAWARAGLRPGGRTSTGKADAMINRAVAVTTPSTVRGNIGRLILTGLEKPAGFKSSRGSRSLDALHSRRVPAAVQGRRSRPIKWHGQSEGAPRGRQPVRCPVGPGGLVLDVQVERP